MNSEEIVEVDPTATVTGVEAYVPADTFQVIVEQESTGNKHIDRLIDHVNREIGVAQETPLFVRLALLEQLCEKNFAKIKEKFNY